MIEKWYNLYNLEPQFKNFLIAENFSPISLKNYLSDFRYFVGWLNKNIKYQIRQLADKNKDLQDLGNFLTLIDADFLNLYRKYLLENNTPLKTINRRLSTIRKFFSFCISQGWLKENPTKKVSNVSHLQTTNYQLPTNNKALESHNIISNIKKISNIKYQISNIFLKFKTKQSKPKISTDSNSSIFSIQYYIGLLIILIFVATLGAGIYNQFFSKSEKTFAYPLAPTTRAGRILSFQGRLTDTLGNPITTATNVTFRLYNVPTGGTALYTAGACSITPNQDGIFNVLIGGSGYTPTPPQEVCGTEIPASIFTENANIYMGITVASDAEMTPRQQIANVGYAINAETLQGLPPGTNSSTIPYINQDGNLLIAASTPGIRSTFTSADFTLSSAKSAVIQSAGLGDVILQATESGTLKFRTGGTTDANTRLFVDNTGNVGIGTTSPSYKLDVSGGTGIVGQFSGRVIGGEAVNSNEFVTLSQLQGGTGSLWLDGGDYLYPNTTFASNVMVPSGRLGVGLSSTPFKLEVTGADAGKALVSLNYTGTDQNILVASQSGTLKFAVGYNGNLTSAAGAKWLPSSDSTTALNIANAAGSSFVTFDTTNQRVGIGTTNPGAKLDISGDIFASGKAKVDYVTDYSNENYGLDPAGTTNFGGYSLKITGGALLALDSGNVGIGTTNPQTKLEVSGDIAMTFGNRHITVSQSQITNSNGGSLTISGGLSNNTGNGGPLYLKGGDSENLSLSGGNVYINGGDGSTKGNIIIANSTEKVGIGTTNPGAKLDISGDIFASGKAKVDYVTDYSNENYGLDPAGTTNFGGYSLKITGGALLAVDSGKVGIGTTSPVSKFHVMWSNTNCGSQCFTDAAVFENNGNVFLQLMGSNSGEKSVNFGSPTNGAAGAIKFNYHNLNELSFWTGGNVEQMVIRENGKVGIGTTGPAGKLHVSGGNAIFDGNVGIGTVNPGDNLNVDPQGAGGILIGNPNTGTGGYTSLRLSISAASGGYSQLQSIRSSGSSWGDIVLNPSGGNVGIGTTSPGNLLSVAKNVGSNYIQSIYNTYNGTNRRQLVIYHAGTSTPATSDVYIAFSNNVNWGFNGSITGNGSGGVQYNTTSDKRLKTNLKIVDNALKIINKINSYYFDFIFKPGEKNIGFMAQDLIDIYPYAVSGDPNSDPLTNPMQVDYSKFTPLLLAGIKEQQSQIASLSGQLTNLEKDLSLTSTGELEITSATGSANFVYDGNLDIETQNSKLKTQIYNLKLKTGEIIERISAFSELIAAKFKAGLIEAENAVVNKTLLAKNIIAENINLTTENLTIAGKKLSDYIDERISQILNTKYLILNTEKIVSPIVETEEIQFKNQNAKIKMQNDNAKLKIVDNQENPVAEFKTDEKETIFTGSLELKNDENKGKLAKIILKGLEEKDTVVIDASGNASFSGQVTTSSLVSDVSNLGNLTAKEASVEGKLVAKEVEAENIKALENNSNVILNSFQDLQNKVNEIPNQVRDDINNKIDNINNNINEIQQILAQIQNQPLPDVSNQTNLSNTTSTSFNDLTVTGNSNLYNVSVSGSILTGQLFIENNSIISLGQELKLSALSQINLFDGAVTIAKDGTITTKGTLIAEGGIKTDTIAPQSGDNLSVVGNLSVLGTLSLPKATDSAVIAASDNFTKRGIFAPALETASASAGVGILPANSQEIIIYNDNVREDSLIYLTPQGANNISLSVFEKKKGYFKVAGPLIHPEIKFDWLIIN